MYLGGFRLQCLHYTSFKPLLLWGEGGGGVKSRVCEQQGGKLLRLLYQLRPRILPLVENRSLDFPLCNYFSMFAPLACTGKQL
jgi:hypothetical protein